MEFLVAYLIFCLIIAAGLGVIPAYIARDKGYWVIEATTTKEQQ